MIQIDGSYREGGGQIIRTSVALSALTGKPVKIINIRAKRCNPGLQAQHVTGILALVKLCNAKVTGAQIGSQTIEFTPGTIKGGKFSIDVGTAGSIPLVLQTLILPAIHAKDEVALEITGGTDVNWSPTIDYMQHIFCYFLRKMSIGIHIDVLERGFYPKGGGKVKVTITPGELKPLNLSERKNPGNIDIWSIASESLKKTNVAERQVDGARKILGNVFGNVTILCVPSMSPGSSVFAGADYENCRLGATSVGERGKPAEKVGEEAAQLLKKQIDSGACLDEWMADQILPYIALSGGAVKVAEITPHCETNIWVIEQFLGKKFAIEKETKIIRTV